GRAALCRHRRGRGRHSPHRAGGIERQGALADRLAERRRGPHNTCRMTGVSKRVHIKTYGCQMNVYDSGRIADVLAPLGYALSEEAEGADLVVLNTCHIREKASEKLYSDLGRLRPLKAAKAQDGGAMMIAVAGCVAQAEGPEIAARAPVADLVVGPQSYHRLPELLEKAARGEREAETQFEVEDKFVQLGKTRRVTGPAAFLTVQEGCDKFCSFCVV